MNLSLKVNKGRKRCIKITKREELIPVYFFICMVIVMIMILQGCKHIEIQDFNGYNPIIK
jgi:hypothetical protein